jgi:hypothetical protein
MLVAANLLRVDTVDARAMVESVRIVRGLEGLPDDCPESVSLATFRSRLAAARRRYDTLDVAGALSDLTGLELELACLAEPPPSAVIFEVELALAQAESVLASVSMEADEETSAFYAREADRALDRAVAAGAGLPMPRGLDRETARALAAARERRGSRPSARAPTSFA